MKRNKRTIIIAASIVIVVIVAFSVLSFAGKDNNNGYSGRNKERTGDNRAPIKFESIGESKNPAKLIKNEGSTDVNISDEGCINRQIKPIKAKAIYLTGSSAGDKTGLERIIQLIKATELNSVVLDIKDDGKLNYESHVPEVIRNMTFHKLYDAEYVLRRLHENNIYVIGRIVCFRDPALAEKRADLAIKRPNGQIWRENGTTAWANPYNEEVWKYNIDIAKEAVDKGFDEIQFDYVRFPAARKADVGFGQNLLPKADVICNFLKTAYTEIHDKKGALLSADVFGIVCESPGDLENIGQDLERIGRDIDYICPMVYPSHYANAAHNGSGQSVNGVIFSAPDLKPYEVVYNSLIKAKNRISKVNGYKARVRPYLQDFTASWLPKGYYQIYGPEQVRQQIKAVQDAGYEEWILWDAANTYTKEALNRK